MDVRRPGTAPGTATATVARLGTGYHASSARKEKKIIFRVDVLIFPPCWPTCVMHDGMGPVMGIHGWYVAYHFFESCLGNDAKCCHRRRFRKPPNHKTEYRRGPFGHSTRPTCLECRSGVAQHPLLLFLHVDRSPLERVVFLTQLPHLATRDAGQATHSPPHRPEWSRWGTGPRACSYGSPVCAHSRALVL